MRGATDLGLDKYPIFNISIHAPRERSDSYEWDNGSFSYDISIHAPRERSDIIGDIPQNDLKISIHAPREWSVETYKQNVNAVIISIHAPRERSDKGAESFKTKQYYFNPRSS